MFLEERPSKRLGENVGNVFGGWYTLDSDVLCFDMLPDEMITNIDMLDPSVERLIERESDGTVVITEDCGRTSRQELELMKERTEPDSFARGLRYSDIFGFSRGTSNSGLTA